MNIRDKKIEHIYEDIDKELTNKNLKQNLTQTFKHNQKVTNNNSEQFNQIYCNFLLDQNSTKKNMPYTTPPSRLIKYTNKQNKEIPFYISPSYKIKNKTPPNISGKRLYNYCSYIKSRQEKQRIEEETKIHKELTPKRIPKANSMERNSKFEDQLYYQTKSNNLLHSTNINNNNENSRTQSMYNSRKSKDYNCYEYKPLLDKNSMLIASKLEPSSSRLLRKKKRYYKIENSLSSSINGHNCGITKSSNSFYNNTSQSYKSFKQSKRCNELYAKGIANIQKRERAHKEQKRKEEEKYKQYSFKPKIIKNSLSINDNITKSTSKGNNVSEMYKKQFEWMKKIENENDRKRKKIEHINYQNCTFKPEISHLNIQNDEKFIMKNLDQMNEYVNKRRDVIKKKKEFEEYRNKRLGHSSSTFTIKPTIPKEFPLYTAGRSSSRSKSKGEQYIKGNVNYQQNFVNNNYNKRNEIQLVDNKFNNYYSGQLFQGSNCNNDFTSQDAFIKAVNELHYKIENLNI